MLAHLPPAFVAKLRRHGIEHVFHYSARPAPSPSHFFRTRITTYIVCLPSRDRPLFRTRITTWLLLALAGLRGEDVADGVWHRGPAAGRGPSSHNPFLFCFVLVASVGAAPTL